MDDLHQKLFQTNELISDKFLPLQRMESYLLLKVRNTRFFLLFKERFKMWFVHNVSKTLFSWDSFTVRSILTNLVQTEQNVGEYWGLDLTRRKERMKEHCPNGNFGKSKHDCFQSPYFLEEIPDHLLKSETE